MQLKGFSGFCLKNRKIRKYFTVNNKFSIEDKNIKNQLNRIIKKLRLSDISNFFLRKLKYRKRFRFI